MNTHTIAPPCPTTPATGFDLRRWLTNAWGRAVAPDQRQQALSGLVRLAETSPHLLADTGLVMDTEPTAGTQIWRCRELGVVIVIAEDGDVTLSDLAVG